MLRKTLTLAAFALLLAAPMARAATCDDTLTAIVQNTVTVGEVTIPTNCIYSQLKCSKLNAQTQNIAVINATWLGTYEQPIWIHLEPDGANSEACWFYLYNAGLPYAYGNISVGNGGTQKDYPGGEQALFFTGNTSLFGPNYIVNY